MSNRWAVKVSISTIALTRRCPSPRGSNSAATPRERRTELRARRSGAASRMDSQLTAGRFSRSQEFERLSNELLVVLEDAAVSGVRVDPERRIWKATRQVVRIDCGHHATVITVDYQDGMVDARQVGRLLKPPRVNRLEVRPENRQCDGLIPIVGALFQALDERFGL